MYKRLTAQIWGVTAFFAVALFAQESSGVAPKKDSVAAVQDSVAVADSAATDSVTTDPLASPEMMAMSEIPADSIVYAAVEERRNHFRMDVIIGIDKGEIFAISDVDSRVSRVRKSAVLFMYHSDPGILFGVFVANFWTRVRGTVVDKDDL